MQDFATTWSRGAKVIVVDPRFSSVAAKADHWLPIKPGTDTALLLAWMNVMITEKLYDADYVARVDRRASTSSPPTSPTSPPSGRRRSPTSPADQIRKTARVMAEHPPQSVIMPGRHVTWYGNDTQRMRATYLVNALLGAYGRHGGMYFNKSPYLEDYPHPPFAVAGSSGGCSAEPGEVSDELPLGPTGKARADGARDTFLRGATALQELIDPMITGDPYPIKGLIVYGTNLLNSIPNEPRTIEALKALDFVVAIDVLPQEHVAWADVVLPEATLPGALRRAVDGCRTRRRTSPCANRRSSRCTTPSPAWWMARELGHAGRSRGLLQVGDDRGVPQHAAAVRRFEPRRDAGRGRRHHPERQALPRGLRGDVSRSTPPSEKIELYSEQLAEAGHDPMPVYEPIDEPPDGYFRLLYGRHPVHTFAKTQNTPVLNELYPENEVCGQRGRRRGRRVSTTATTCGWRTRTAPARPDQGQGDPTDPHRRRLHGPRLRPGRPQA